MFDDLVAKNNIDLPENDILFVKALIAGDPGSCSYVPGTVARLAPLE